MENHNALNEVEAELEEAIDRYTELQAHYKELEEAYRNTQFEIRALKEDLRQAREEVDRRNNIASMKRVNEKENEAPEGRIKTLNRRSSCIFNAIPAFFQSKAP